MSDFSRLPQEELSENLKEGYVGLYFEQGVPILDRDLNLMQDLIATAVRSTIARYIGSGLPAGRQGFAIQAIPADNDFRILAGDPPPGTCLVGGIEVFIDEDVTYSKQPGVPPLSAPTTGEDDPRSDTIYLDVSLETVDGARHDRLLNAGDVGVQTSVRLRPTWTVRVAEKATEPPKPAPGHAHYALALLKRRRDDAQIRPEMIVDLRQTRLNLDHVERRISTVESLVVTPALRSSPNQFEPKNVAPGGSVKIFGRNLDLAPVKVHFGAFSTTPTSVNRNEIVADVPAGASGRVEIKVTTGGGVVESDDELTIRGGGPPPVFADLPNEFDPRVGGAGVAVTLFGSNFNLEPVSVHFGSVRAPEVTVVSDHQIVAKVPLGVTEPVKITVTTRSDSVTSHDSFTAGAPPAFAGTNQMKPRRGGVGALVILSGTNFHIEPVSVEFGTVRSEEPSFTEREIRTRVPTGAPGRCHIKVTTGIGSVISDEEFTVLGGG
jgi:hypothetical protein